MRPLQCVLQHHASNLHVSTHMATQDDNNHAAIPMRSATTDSKKQIELHEQPHVAEHQWGTDKTRKRSQPQPSHTQGTFHRHLQPLYAEKHKVWCSGFLPNTSPMQPSCGHYNAFCSITSLSHHPSSSPFPLVTATLPHLPQSPPFVITTSPPFVITTSLSHHSLHHHFPQSPPFVYVMYCYVMYCYVMYCFVM